MAKLKKDKENPLIKQLKRVLELKEVETEEGLISNKEAICQMLMDKAIKNGDLLAVNTIIDILKSENKKK